MRQFICAVRCGPFIVSYSLLECLSRVVTTHTHTHTQTVIAELQSEPPPTRAADTNSEDGHSSDDVQSSDSDDLSETDSDTASDDATVHTSHAAFPVKRGTEIRLQGLQMREGVGTVKCEGVKVVVQCTRCRAQHDVVLKGER